ncbi:aryl-sulfate sulfotransferase [Arsenophonus sp. aPb]|uniref:aryl-sulfate sulfotransferase n=1 Tax=Arsenophonus sp. aPb TaxID=3041619 RepID=UPI00246993E3|nr:aryl-sulfate sulfotransferase [Arsenophonus sp. aPb]WGL99614.1 aryl-sulfate sulfotransferase [Arsenophonus sp. aPb]
MKYIIKIITLFLISISLTANAIPMAIKHGTTLYDPAKAWSSYILFASRDAKTYLIDMMGNEINRWPYHAFPAWPIAGENSAKILVELATIDNYGVDYQPFTGMRNVSIGEVNWQGKVVWQYGSKIDPAHQHHEIQRLSDGNILILRAKKKRIDGWDHDIIDDYIDIISPEGNSVWHWSVADHFDKLGFDSQQQKIMKGARIGNLFHINTATPLGKNKWYDSGDKRFAPENILINSRNGNLAVIICRETGEIVWRLGPNFPSVNYQGEIPRPLDQIIGAHNIHMIPYGLPGAGNLLIFDNQGAAGFPPAKNNILSASRVIEIDPQSMKIVWEYNADKSKQPLYNFYSSFMSNAQRLPNGNTLINEGQSGRLFQVTPEGEIVWEYVSPYYGNAVNPAEHKANKIYRAYAVDYSWAPKGTKYSEHSIQADCVNYKSMPGCN